MKTKRKVAFFLALMSLFYCVSLIQKTYAKYITSATANTDFTIAKWNILINDQDVTSNSNFSNTISPTFNGTDNIKSGVIAPSATGYFDITIDGSNSDVSFTYTVTANPSTSSTVTDLKLTDYEINGTRYAITNSVTGDILYTDTEKEQTIRFYVTWNDDSSTENMNNANDTIAANNGIAAFDVNVNLIQKKN